MLSCEKIAISSQRTQQKAWTGHPILLYLSLRNGCGPVWHHAYIQEMTPPGCLLLKKAWFGFNNKSLGGGRCFCIAS